MSAFGGKPDIGAAMQNVRLVPIADLGEVENALELPPRTEQAEV